MEALPKGLHGLPLRTPTLPPATKTNTLIVGEAEFVVIEPATPHADEQERLLAQIRQRILAGATLKKLLVTHHHSDHVGGVERLRQEFGAPVAAHALTRARVDFAVDEVLDDGAVVSLAGGHDVHCVHTPGHAPGHLVYVHRATGIAHAGDMVAGEGTILIDPDDAGDMGAYLRSLERMKTLGLRELVPAHGPVLRDPGAILSHYIAHRLAREQRVVEGFLGAAATIDELLPRVYNDTPKMLYPLARRSLRAHLDKLVVDGRVTHVGDERYLPQAPS